MYIKQGAALFEALRYKQAVGSTPNGITGFVIDMILPGSTQSVTEINSRNIFWGVKATGA
jgi:hypothetical protein